MARGPQSGAPLTVLSASDSNERGNTYRLASGTKRSLARAVAGD